ncbi:MAG TPA: hypothetical protein VFW28_06150 [Micropepsaceae bacterium]|nr:hypothetical protein [Micropepsaceae bacterium]
MLTTTSQALLIGAPTITSTGGKVKVRSSANTDARKTKADGTAVDASSVGIGAAVAINDIDITNKASTGTATISSLGLDVEATVTERAITAPVTPLTIIDVTKDTVFVGKNSGLETGDEVKYDKGDSGNTAIGGLSDGSSYFVYVGDDGTVKLYDTKQHAEENGGTGKGLVDITSTGSGTKHAFKFGLLNNASVTFDPSSTVDVLNLGDDAGLISGDAVKYKAANNTPISGLTDGTTYYAIDLTNGHYQLAASRQDGLDGKAIALGSVGDASQKVIETNHAVRSEADSGAGSDKVGIAGALALNLVKNHTQALVEGGSVTVSGGDVTINAVNNESDLANATSKAKGGSVGIGVSVGLNILTLSDTDAEMMDGTAFTGTGLGNVNVTSTAMRTVVTKVEAGSQGNVSVTPAVAMAFDQNDSSTARIGTGTGTGTLAGSGVLNVSATHAADFSGTKADAAAGGDNAAIGAGLGISFVDKWSTDAEVSRSATAGSVQILATSSLVSAPEASASAKGGDTKDDNANKKTDDQVSNNSNTSSTSAPTTDSSTTNGSDANSTSTSKSGGGGSSVGIAASIAVNYASVSNTADVGDSVMLHATSGAVKVSATAKVDAQARTDSTAINQDGSVDIAAAFSLNDISITNKATVNTGADVTGNGITVEAVTPQGDQNNVSARALAAAGNKSGDLAIAGVFAINVVDTDTEATTADGSHLHGGAGEIDITARHDLDIQALAASAAVSKSGTAVGVAVAVNVVGTGTGGSITTASIGDDTNGLSPATVDGTGAVKVTAEHTINPMKVELPKDVTDVIGNVDIELTSLAVSAGGSMGSSTPGIGGSVDLNIFDTTTHAFVDHNATVGDPNGSDHISALTVSATDTTAINSGAGSVGVGIGGSGIGVGLDFADITKNTKAYIESDAQVTTTGLTSVTTVSTENILSISANIAVGTTDVGIAGSGSVEILNTTSYAYIDSNATVHTGGVNIDAEGNFDLTMVAGSIGVGSDVGIGASITTLVHTDDVEAWIGSGATVTSTDSNDIKLNAHSYEKAITIAAAGGASADVSIAGSGAINILDETTKAFVDRNATVNSGGNLSIHANDDTTIVSVAGSLAVSESVGVGVGADVGTLTKTTEAYIESNVTSDVEGNIDISAKSTEALTGVAAGISISGSAAVTVDAGVHVLNITTRAFIGDDPDDLLASAGAGNVHADGSVGVQADEHTVVNAIVGMLSVSGSAAVTAGGVVTVTNKHTEAFIGAGALVTADGGNSITAATGKFSSQPSGSGPGSQDGIHTSSINGSQDADSLAAQGAVKSPGVSNANSPNIDDGSDSHGNQRSNPNTSSDMLSGSVTLSPSTASVSGIAVSATNYDQVNGFAAGLAGAGSAAVALTAVVNAINDTTTAYVGANANVSGPNVSVNAGNDFHHLAVAAALAVSGGGSVAPAIDVSVITNNTTAYIDTGATVAATAGDVTVTAGASEDMLLVGFGIAGGTVGIGGSVSVLVVNDTTKAYIAGGDLDGDGNVIAGVTAHDNVVLRANDDTNVVIVDGAGGFGLGGAGASVGVLSLGKTTEAYVGDGAVVEADGNGAGVTALAGTLTGGDDATGFDTTTVHGLVVEATSSENVFHLNVAAGGGAVGVAGGITVTTLNSSTHAYIGAAEINQVDSDSAGNAAQDVYVNAANEARVVTFAGGIAGGAGALAGAVDIGVLRNNVNAEIQTGAKVTAQDAVHVNALGIKDINSIAASGAGGVVGLAGSVSVWSVGRELSTNYTGDGGSSNNALQSSGGTADDSAEQQGSDAGGRFTSLLGSSSKSPSSDGKGLDTGAHDTSTANTSQDRTSAITYGALNGTGGFATVKPDKAGLGGTLTGPKVGTNAAIGGGAKVTTITGDIDVAAHENLQMNMTEGGVAAGFAGIGAGIGVMNVASNVSATAGGTLSAGGTLGIHADLFEHVDDLAFAGAAGFVGLGAAVAVVNDSSTTTAGLIDDAIVHNAGNIDITAHARQNFSEQTIGVAIGAIGGGASFTKLDVENGSAKEVWAYVGDNVNIGQDDGDSVGGLTVEAKSNITANGTAFGLAGGVVAASANFAFVDVKPQVIASIGDGSTGANIKLTKTGDIDVNAESHDKGDAQVIGASVGALAGGLSKTSVDIEPEVRSKVVKGKLRARNLTVSSSVNQGDGSDFGANAQSFTAAVGGAAIEGALASATMSPTIESVVGSGATIADSGDVTITADGNNKALSKSAGVGGGVVGIGETDADAHAEGSASAHLDGQIKQDDGTAGAVNLNIHSTSADAASASVMAVTGGLVAVGSNSGTVTVKPTISGYVSTSGTIQLSGNIDITATGNPEGDAIVKGIGIGGVQLGGTESQTTLTPNATAYLVAGTANAGGSVSVVATAEPISGAEPSYQVISTDTTNDIIEVDNHGLSTGDTVVYGGATTGGVTNGREYNVIVPQTGSPAADDPNHLQFGMSFDGGVVNNDRDTIVFAAPHNFVTGDKVVYINGDGSTAIGGLTSGDTYYVLVVDGHTIKLTTYDPTVVTSHNLQNFTPTAGSGTTISLANGFTNNEAVTYHAPQANTFSSLQVDVDAGDTKTAHDPDLGDITVATLANQNNDNIEFVDSFGRPIGSGFSNGDLVQYNSNGTAIGGLKNGQTYRVVSTGGDNNSAVQLGAVATATVKFHNDGTGNNPDSIERTDGGDFTAEGFVSGQHITISGVTGSFKLTGVTASTLTLDADNVLTDGDAGSRTIESDAIALDKTVSDKGTVHSLIKVSDLPLTYFDGASNVNMDGRTFYVVNRTASDFGLALTPGGTALNLTGQSGATSDHLIGPESVDLTKGSGKQFLHIDLTASLNGATLLGPGGVPLNVISPPIGDGVSSAAASGSGGGVVSVNLNDAKMTDDPTVTSYIGGTLHAGGDVTIETTSTTNATGHDTNASGGLVGLSDSTASSEQTNTSNAYADTGAQIAATGSVSILANSSSTSQAASDGVTGGFVGGASTDASSTVDYSTTATVKDDANIVAGNTIHIAANTGMVQKGQGGATGVGFGGDGDGSSSVTTNTGLTESEIGNASSVNARSVAVSATVSQLTGFANGDGEGGGFVALGSGTGTVSFNTQNKVAIDPNASVTGYEGVDFIVKYDGVDTHGSSFAQATGLFGNVSSDANNNTTLDSQVVGAGSALITAGPRDPGDAALAHPGGFDHLALYSDTENGSVSVDAHADDSKRSLATGGSSDNGGSGLSIPNNKIDLSSNVVILSGRSPELIIDNTGPTGAHIAKAVNVSVNGDQTSGDITGDISVDNITNNDPGQVDLRTSTDDPGAITGSGGTWDFRDSFSQVRIINDSDHNLTINGINVVNTTVDPTVDLSSTHSRSLTFDIKRTVAPTFVDIEDTADPTLTISGVIENPIGTTRIVNVNGNITSTGNRSNSSDQDPTSLVRTNILDIEADNGSVGTSSNRVNVDVVDSANLPAATDFISARVTSLDHSIFLGQNQFFTGELVQYHASGTALPGLTNNDYYYVIESADGLSVQLAAVGSPTTPVAITPTGSPTDAHSLTPAQRFTVIAAGDATAGNGFAWLDIKGRLRDTADHKRTGITGVSYGVIIDAVNTSGDANLLLRGSVQETNVSGTTYPGGTAGTAGGVSVSDATKPGTYFTHFDSDPPPGPALDTGVFANEGASATHIDSTYDIRALNTDGNVYRPGITSDRNIIIAAADPDTTAAGHTVNVLGITQIIGGGTANASDQHHIDALTNGFINLAEKTGDLRVGQITSTQSDVTLSSPAAIIDALNDGIGSDADVSGRNITMTAGNNLIGDTNDQSGRGGVGTPGNFLEINVNANGGALGVLNVTDTASATHTFNYGSVPFDPAGSGTYGVFLTQTSGDMEIDTVQTKGDVSLATVSGSLVDGRNGGAGGDAAGVIGDSINLYANGGNIGQNGSVSDSQANTTNDLEIDSQAYGYGTIAARASNNIFLTETLPTTGGSSFNNDAEVALMQALTGNARFTVRESAAQGEDLNLLPNGNALFLENAPEAVSHGLINTPTGSILLRVGDDITTNANAQILAGQNIDIYGDFARTSGPVSDTGDAGDGTVMHLSGVIAHGPTANGYLTRIFGNSDSDQVYFDQTFLGVVPQATIDAVGFSGYAPPGGLSQHIPQDRLGTGFTVLSDYSGGNTIAYGSNAPTPGTSFAPTGDGEDFFVVNQLQSMNYIQTVAATNSSDTLTLDGQAGSDTYVINTAGSKGADRNYVVNALDSGAPDDGVNMLLVYGRNAPSSEEGSDSNGNPLPFDDIFLLRRTTGIAGATLPTLYSDNTAFVAVLHDSLTNATTSDPNASQGVRNQFLERVNYDSGINGRLMVFGQGGNDYFAVDDNAATTTLDGGTGDDTFQIGQIYGLQRDGTQPNNNLGSTLGGSLVSNDFFPQLPNSLTPQSIYGTVATTRGWLSAGATSPLLAQGGEGNDTFTVYSNQAPVRLEGDDGNDLFTVRAFALAETDPTTGDIKWIDPEQQIAQPKLTRGFSTAATTDIRTGAGNNQVEYNINAPVSVDGGPGFDKLIVLGTEFADHIVVTDKGIFGAGLTVSYQNIEVLEIDALEGDDIIDVLSTQPGVVTRVIGGLGNDTINVAGDVTGEVVSRDINGTSGVINDRVTSSDPRYASLIADGEALSVARPTQGQVIIEESGGFTDVREGGPADTYQVYLAQAPAAGTHVYVTVSAAMNPQEEHGNTGLLQSGDINDNQGAGDSILLAEDLGTPVDYDRDVMLDGNLVHIPKRAIVLEFDDTNWDKAHAKTVSVSAVDDTLAEGDRTVTISHSVLSDDPIFDHAIVRNVEVTVHDNDQPGILVTQLDPLSPTGGLAKYDNFQSDNATTVLEGTPALQVNDLYAIELAKAPTGTVRVDINPGDNRVVLSSFTGDSRFGVISDPTGDTAGSYYVDFDSTNWNTPVLIQVAARNDSAPEDPHDTTISHTIDAAHTTDSQYAATHTVTVNGVGTQIANVAQQNLDARVIDDENAGVFTLDTAGQTLVSSGSAQNGAGTGDSYDMRLTSQPTAPVNVSLITDGQTDITPDLTHGIQYAAIGGLNPVKLFEGDVSINGAAITRSGNAALGSWTTDGFSPGMHIRIAQNGATIVDGATISSISPDGQTITLTASTGLVETLTDVVGSQLVEQGLYTGSITYTAAAQPFLLYDDKVSVSGGGTTLQSLANFATFIDDGFAAGQTIAFGDGSGSKFTILSISSDGKSMTLSGATGFADGSTVAVKINKMLGTLTRTDGSSWLDSGFLEGQIFQLSGPGAVSAGLTGQTFKAELITSSTPGDTSKLDMMVVSDPARTGSVVPNAAKLTASGTATMTVTQWAAVATFTPTTDASDGWNVMKSINVVADPAFDIQPGHENLKSFPKVEHRLDGIRGPLLIEGGPTSADRSLNSAILLPGEANAAVFQVPPQPPESQSIDTLNIFDDGSRQNQTGTLTSTALTGLGMGGDLNFITMGVFDPNGRTFNEPGVYPGGISFGSIGLQPDPNHPGKQIFSTDGGRSTIEVLNVLLGQGNDNLDIQGTLVPGPDHNPLTGAETTVSTHGGITAVHGGGNALLQASGLFSFTAAVGDGNAQLARTDLLDWTQYGFTAGQRIVLSTPGGAAAFTITGFADQTGGTKSIMLLAGASANVPTQSTAFTGSIAVVDALSVSGSFTLQSDRIIRTDNLPWQNLGFAIGQQIALTVGGKTELFTITDFDNTDSTTPSGLGSALLVNGNPLSLFGAGGPVTGTVAVTNRNNVSGTFSVTSNTITSSTPNYWTANGFAAGQTIVISGEPNPFVVQSITNQGETLNLTGATVANTGTGKSLLIGVVRVGGDNIVVDGASAVFNSTYNVAPGQITRTDGKRWDTDLHFAIGQQITLTSGTVDPNSVQNLGGPSDAPQIISQTIGGQFVVTGFSADGMTLLVSGGTLPAVQNVAGTVVINSPLVVYGDTSQDGVWYNGKPDTQSTGKFSNKPMPHEDALAVTFGTQTFFSGTPLQHDFGTITRNDGHSWSESGFVPEGLIMVDGTLVGTTMRVVDTRDGSGNITSSTLVLFKQDLTTGGDLSNLWTGTGVATGSGAHNIVQRNRLGQNTDFFVFPLADPYQYAGNDVIDARNLYANIPDGQLPAIGFTAYGGVGDDLIYGSQAGDQLAGGSGNDTIIGGRGADIIYGDAGFNVDLITRVLTVASTAGTSGAKNLDPLVAGNDLLIGDTPGSTKTDVYGDYDDTIIGDLGQATQNVAGARDTTKSVAGQLPQDLQTTLRIRKVQTLTPQYGGNDFIYGNGGQDVLIGGPGNDAIDGGAGSDLIFGDNVSLDRTTHLDNFTSLRFQTLQGTQIYSTATATDGQDLADGAPQLDPRGNLEPRLHFTYGPSWGDYQITLVGHSDSAQNFTSYTGNDYIAGGQGDDSIFGELGNDVVQGDGSIDFVAYQNTYDANGNVVVNSNLRGRVGASRGADGTFDGGASTGLLTWYASYDSPSADGNDYIEGGGGSDVIFGNQGQDDIIGGSSDLFAKTDGTAPPSTGGPAAYRPDAGDLIFGGSGTQIARNAIGDATIDPTTQVITTTTNGHANDSDMILGDNGDIIRLVGVNHTQLAQRNGSGLVGGVATSNGFLSFNYDSDATLKIVPRIARLLDYTPGGPNYSPAALKDRGGADEIHGGSGDDFIYGETGNDRLFGDGQDDDIIGGWGNDWIDGGTGDDGLLGDDGRIMTSRNTAGNGITLAEPLYGVTTLLGSDPDSRSSNGNVANEFIYTPGNVQVNNINIAGNIKKQFDITPFSSDPNWNGSTDEFPIAGGGGVGVQPQHYNDDIIYGGLGSDWIHGGSGDDALSGAEALPLAAAGLPSASQTVPNVQLVDNLVISGFLRPYNPGNILLFNPVDPAGQHGANQTRGGQFALYNEFNPLQKIVVAGSATGTQYQFLLNFNETEGVVRPGGNTPGSQSVAYAQTNDDGADKIFGDLGNDWLVGGTGRDDMYGGLGNDLINADDNLNTAAGANNVPDTSPYYEDIAYGGGGRDVLIANTGGDRLIDWAGEFNSYLVPFAPFGMGTVSRTLQPQLPEYLYALSFSDGADPTRAADTGASAARNGEPFGELGVVLQHDAGWHDQTGAPSDPQAGNVPGGARDVLRSASFGPGPVQPFQVVSGTATTALTNASRYQLAPTTSTGDSITLLNTSDILIPNYFELQATLNAGAATAGGKSNAYVIFDYQSDIDFKFAGIDVTTGKLEIGHRNATGWIVDASASQRLLAGTDYSMLLKINGSAVSMLFGTGNNVSLTFSFPSFDLRVDSMGVTHMINDGLVGLGSSGSSAQFGTLTVQAPPSANTLNTTVTTSKLTGGAKRGVFTVDTASLLNAAPDSGGVAIDLINDPVAPGYALTLSVNMKTQGQGGFVFDYQGTDYFKYVTLNADTGQVVIGHHTPAGYFTDAGYSTPISSTSTYSLSVSVKGGQVTVTLGTATVLTYHYNATVTDGGYGVISLKGATSGQSRFGTVTVTANDPRYLGTPVLQVADDAAPAGEIAALTPDQLAGIVAEAKQLWTAALGPNDPRLSLLDNVNVVIAKLPDGTLGETIGNTIYIDVGAAGWGWFVDSTPADNGEFTGTQSNAVFTANSSSPAYGHMDLLSTVLHEMGNAMGFAENSANDVQNFVLPTGVRRLPTADLQAIATNVDVLLAAAVPDAGNSVVTLDAPGASALDTITVEARARLGEAGLDATQFAQLDTVSIRFDTLSGGELAEQSNGAIVLDSSAAGNGWFVDPTPGDDAEFLSGGNSLVASGQPAAGHVDLLTAVEHELGVRAGLPHTKTGLMAEHLTAGVREVPPAVFHYDIFSGIFVPAGIGSAGSATTAAWPALVPDDGNSQDTDNSSGYLNQSASNSNAALLPDSTGDLPSFSK